MTTPSTRNGIRMNQSVAPTDFMMEISSFRTYMVSLMVLVMMKSETTRSNPTIHVPTTVTV